MRRIDPAAVNLWAFDAAPLRSSTEKGFPLRSSTAFESRSVRRKGEMLEPAMFTGLGLVAVWAYLRYPELRPCSLVRAAVHVAVSFAAFALLPTTLSLLLPVVSSHALAPYVVLALLIPSLTYVLLSWVWLLARVLHDLSGGTPRGGHPVSAKS